jgi:rhamnogalacturonyl hydrolase YesR
MERPRHAFSTLTIFVLFITCFCSGTAFAQSTRPAVRDPQQVKELMKRVMNFQIKAYGDTAPVNWQAAAFWSGVMGAYDSTHDEDFYQAAKKWADAAGWKISKRPFHADDIAVGQSYCDMYLREKQPQMIADLKTHVDEYFDKKMIKKGEVGRATWSSDEVPMTGRNLWWWCDALYMAPPTLVRLSAATGDHRYTDIMHGLFWNSVEHLFDPTEGLFYRDANYFFDKKQSPGGKKIFWSRGNGWVYAGIIRTLDYLPKDDPNRSKYIELFQKMTPSIVKHQGEDGLWRVCMNEPSWMPEPETSGTAFFCFGLLAGIDRGYIDRETYLPVALRAWDGLTSHVSPEGLLGFAQKEGAAPDHTDANTFRDYANGAFLLAGSEMCRLNSAKR